MALVAGVGWWYCSTISLTDRPPAKADISLFGDRLLRGHSPIEMNNTSDAMSSEKLSFWVKPPASKHCPQFPVRTAQARNAGLQFRVPCYLQQNCWQPLTRWSCDMIKLHKKSKLYWIKHVKTIPKHHMYIHHEQRLTLRSMNGTMIAPPGECPPLAQSK